MTQQQVKQTLWNKQQILQDIHRNSNTSIRFIANVIVCWHTAQAKNYADFMYSGNKIVLAQATLLIKCPLMGVS